MLLHLTWRPKAGYTHEDSKRTLRLWANWQAPAGFEIKMHVIEVNGGGFALVEAETAEAVHKALAPWAGLSFDYEIVPVVDIDTAVPILESGIAAREA